MQESEFIPNFAQKIERNTNSTNLEPMVSYKKMILLMITISLFSCSVWKKNLNAIGNYETAIDNAISDFINTSPLYNRYDVFSIFCSTDTAFIRVSIQGRKPDEPLCVLDTPCYYNRYYEHDHKKLFVWADERCTDNQGFIKKIDEYNMIGNVLIVFVDYNKNSVTYYFCPQNLKQYRKVRGENARKIKKVKATFNCK